MLFVIAYLYIWLTHCLSRFVVSYAITNIQRTLSSMVSIIKRDDKSGYRKVSINDAIINIETMYLTRLFFLAPAKECHVKRGYKTECEDSGNG